MPTIEEKPLGWLVHVQASELVCDGAGAAGTPKPLPYPTCIGYVSLGGGIYHWVPAGWKPRGYVAAARRMLAEVRDGLRITGELEAREIAELAASGSSRARRLLEQADEAVQIALDRRLGVGR